MMQIHPQARTTPAVRAEIARSTEPTSVVAKRYGVSDETVRKWRKRGEQACQDRSSRPKRLPWRATEEERAIICGLVTDLWRSPISLSHLGFEGERADAAQI
jgi:transposase-like protein